MVLRYRWRKIWSTNSLERVNKETERRTNVVRVFPNDDAMLTFAGVIFAEQHNEWQASDRCELTMNNATVLGLEHPITLKLEADLLASIPSVADLTGIPDSTGCCPSLSANLKGPTANLRFGPASRFTLEKFRERMPSCS